MCCAGPVSLGELVTRTPAGVVQNAASAASLGVLDARIADCFACPRLVAWREDVAAVRRASFRDQRYWGRPVTGFGVADAQIAILGLAPAAHGGNRTGRIFTGDRSGDWLFAALHRAGLANQPTSVSVDDGLRLGDAYVNAGKRCPPPQNSPTTDERDNCLPYLVRELRLLRSGRVLVPLGSFAWTGTLLALAELGGRLPRPRPRFGHGAEAEIETGERSWSLVGCFHPSQQNTLTGKLPEPMMGAGFPRRVGHCAT